MPDPTLRITVDANIPFATEAFGALGTVRSIPGREIRPEVLAETDVLLVRSVTHVDDALVDRTPVRFVGTATAGVDHVDQAALARRGIAFASAPGSNAASVADWVLAALLAVAADRGEKLRGRTLGVIGVGAVGGRLVPRASALGLTVLACDPPRQRDGAGGMVSLAEVLTRADIVTLHTPLTASGEWPTLGMIDADAARSMKPGAWLVNAARGPVVTTEAARFLAASRPVLLDVWPGEPAPDPALVDAVAVATPHIAGYAWDGKVRGTQMLADALRQWLAGEGVASEPWAPTLDPPPALAVPAEAHEAAWLDALARQATNVRADDARFRAALAGAVGDVERVAAFADLRKTYPPRREMSQYAVRGAVPDALRQSGEAGLGMALEDV